MSDSRTTEISDQSLITEIYVVGAASTGKTTLCDALRSRLRLQSSAFIKEAARDVMESQGYTRNDVGKIEMQIAIMNEQLSRERVSRIAAAATSRILLSDRSAVDTIVYAIITSVDDEDAERKWRTLADSDRFQSTLPIYQKFVFFLLAPVAEWLVDDGIRKIDDQDYCHETFRKILERLGINFREIGPEMKSLEERVETVIKSAHVGV